MPNKSPWDTVGNIILDCLTSDAAKRIGKRLETLSRASFVPDTGSGNNAAGAFLLGMATSSFKHLAAHRNIPKVMPGDECLYRFADITKTAPATKAKQPAKRK